MLSATRCGNSSPPSSPTTCAWPASAPPASSPTTTTASAGSASWRAVAGPCRTGRCNGVAAAGRRASTPSSPASCRRPRAQGYSEPGSGSDLASLQCKAVRDGDSYVINGTKIWTTHAQWANRIFCLVRTSSAGKPQQGISFLLFDMDTPGITVRPIISISGDHELNQVFFDDVRVPATALLGEENKGWTIAKYLLVHERGGTYAPALRARLGRLQRAAAQAFADRPADDDERRDVARLLADAACRIDALHALEQQVLAARIRGEEQPIAPSVGKLLGTEPRQFIAEIAVTIAGPYAAARLPQADCAAHALALPEDAIWAMSTYLNDRAASIYAGTNEVQRNLIAQHLLSH